MAIYAGENALEEVGEQMPGKMAAHVGKSRKFLDLEKPLS